MPDLDAPEREQAEPSERRSYNPARPAINLDAAYHEFKPSEFEQGAGYCDLCGGGPDAAIHQKPVDQMERIADALERIADVLELSAAAIDDLGDCVVAQDTGKAHEIAFQVRKVGE